MPTITSVDLDRLDLREILLRGSDIWNQWRKENPDVFIDLNEVDLSEADLNGVDLSGASLFRANFSGADLSGADLSGASLFGIDLSGANLSGANLSGAELSYVRLGDADLSNANLSGADFRDADFPFSTEATFSIKIFDQDIDPEALEQLKTAIADYAEAAGYTDPEILSEEYGSFFSRIRYKIAKILFPEVIEQAIREAVESTSPKYDLRGAQFAGGFGETVSGGQTGGTVSNKSSDLSTEKLATATAKLLKAVENFDNIVLTLEKIILVKYTAPDGQTKTIVRIVSTEIQNKLECTPHILYDPKTLIAFLQGESTVT